MKRLSWFVACIILLSPVLSSDASGPDTKPALIYSNDQTVVPEVKVFHGPSERFVKRSNKTCQGCHNGSSYPGSDFFLSESRTKISLLWVSSMLALFICAVGMFSSFSIWMLGKSKSLHREIRWPVVWRTFFSGVIFEKKVFRLSLWRWFNFISISIGFVTLFLVFLFSFIARSLFHSDFFLNGAGSNLLDFALDFLGLVILLGIVSAAVRRYVAKPAGLVNQSQDLFLLILLFLIITSGFVLEAFRLAAFPWYPEMRYSFVGNALAHLIRSEQIAWLPAHFYLWLIHGTLALVLLALVPYTKIVHLATAPLAIVITASEQPMHLFQPGREKAASSVPLDLAAGEVASHD